MLMLTITSINFKELFKVNINVNVNVNVNFMYWQPQTLLNCLKSMLMLMLMLMYLYIMTNINFNELPKVNVNVPSKNLIHCLHLSSIEWFNTLWFKKSRRKDLRFLKFCVTWESRNQVWANFCLFLFLFSEDLDRYW